MWVVPLSGSILGFAQFPGGPYATDGVVMGSQFFGSSDYDTENNFYLQAPFDKGRTTTHEIGHYLNLRHIWGDGGCSVDDGVDDTPLAADSNGGCPNYPSKSCPEDSSSTSDMFMNYMDYVDDACMFMFSEGKKTRSYALFEPGGFRENLGELVDGCELPAAANLSLEQRSTSSLSLSWSPVAGADAYQIAIDEAVFEATSNFFQFQDLQAGTLYDIKVRGICTDGGVGQYSETFSFNTLGCYTGPLELTLKTDDYAAETSWVLRYNGKIVQADSITYQNNTTYTEVFDFGEGNYEFEIFDAENDGICCGFGNGSYSLIDGTGRLIVSGGDFGPSESSSFCVQNESTIDCSNPSVATLGINSTPNSPALFEFVAADNQYYTISSIASTAVNTQLVIYSDCSTLLADSDDAQGSLQSEVSLVLNAGEKLFIKWEDTHSTAGFDWTLTASKIPQTISFPALPDKDVDSPPFELTATSSSSLPISFSSSNETVATVQGNTVTILAAGETTITASQSGNDTFAAAAVERVLNVDKLDQTISITPIADKSIIDDDFSVEAVASSGLQLSFELSGPASITGSVLSLDGIPGTVTLFANQVGSDRYKAARDSISFEVKELCDFFSITEIITTDASCSGSADGSIEVVLEGGSSPFQFTLNNGTAVESNLWEGLEAGEYTLNVEDSAGCTRSASISLKEPLPLSIVSEKNDSDSPEGNGSINLIVEGGSGSYNYTWSNGQSSASIANLEVGVYTVIVTDENGCSLEETFEVGGITANAKEATHEFLLFPNPARDVIRIVHHGASDYVSIYSVKGILVKTTKIKGSSTEIEIGDLSSGLYYIRLNQTGSIQKFIKQ
jgi:hypothetical protein